MAFVYIIICNKTMNHQIESIINQTLNFLFSEFDQALKISQLLKHQAQYNVFMHQLITYELVFSAQFPRPSRKSIYEEDSAPVNIQLDHLANFRLEQIAIPHDQQQQKPLEYEKSNQEKRSKKMKKENSIFVNDQDKGVFALSEPILSQEQIQLQDQIIEIKRNLNFKRRIVRENEEETHRRYEEIQNRKHLELPNKQFTFDFNGDFLFKTKQNLRKNLAVLTNGKSEDLGELLNQTKRNNDNQDDSQRERLVSRGTGGSREGKRLLFGNSGKRQVSNLPFIKLSENIKLTQSHRSASGPDHSSYTLKSYQSRGESTFKHFAEIEKERTERLYSLKRSSQVSCMTEDEPEQKFVNSHVQVRKQSKRMQKYLKKLTEDRSKDFVKELNKSSNFSRINSPHGCSIHRYYKHNFDDDKKSICQSSLGNIPLNNSRFMESSKQ